MQIYIDATFLGRAEVDLAGRWSFKPRVRTGGRRTFTIVDEITTRQFGPLPLIIAGGTPPAKKAATQAKAKPVVKPKSGPPKKTAPLKGVRTIKIAAKGVTAPVKKKALPVRKVTPKAKGKSRSLAPLR
ncbi:hypothetical protein EON77_21790 [bacterium]|nr:MAG: hypothetical protein EON77_21790 [bacterium]